eukprot:gnl/TRDRNA2_/TRDRNA2_134135_c0_seq1.p1 gnl/TRDRNA2_/TRDRNA2_134135_c0~~gnl/TRDRNA2_/TRDRNA2_134135_c0_seq1.p1  ORF type:complete len:455 (+),score=87.07 gnl/TRDRNA2_/TRDRNA2_134135_c0_seq1:154-1518(+)
MAPDGAEDTPSPAGKGKDDFAEEIALRDVQIASMEMKMSELRGKCVNALGLLWAHRNPVLQASPAVVEAELALKGLADDAEVKLQKWFQLVQSMPPPGPGEMQMSHPSVDAIQREPQTAPSPAPSGDDAKKKKSSSKARKSKSELLSMLGDRLEMLKSRVGQIEGRMTPGSEYSGSVISLGSDDLNKSFGNLSTLAECRENEQADATTPTPGTPKSMPGKSNQSTPREAQLRSLSSAHSVRSSAARLMRLALGRCTRRILCASFDELAKRADTETEQRSLRPAAGGAVEAREAFVPVAQAADLATRSPQPAKASGVVGVAKQPVLAGRLHAPMPAFGNGVAAVGNGFVQLQESSPTASPHSGVVRPKNNQGSGKILEEVSRLRAAAAQAEIDAKSHRERAKKAREQLSSIQTSLKTSSSQRRIGDPVTRMPAPMPMTSSTPTLVRRPQSPPQGL